MASMGGMRGEDMRPSRGNKQTVKELAALIGKGGAYNVARDMWIFVEIEDVRISYGEVQVLIHPVAGSGAVWVLAANVKATV